MTQPSFQFDQVAAQINKHRGMDFAAEHRARMLTMARDYARQLCQNGGAVTADDVQERLIRAGYSPKFLGNAAGSIFKGNEWRCLGWTASKRVSSHGRAIRVWTLVSGV